jgi:hypothetical protein
MDRSNHYEAAFEAYLQWHRLCYVAVDERRRSLFEDIPVKSLDFIVYGPGGARLLVDVKGRRFPGGKPERPRRTWECWSTREDVDGLERWKEVFGPGFRGLLVFIYELLPEVILPDKTDDLWTWRGRRYLLRAVPVEEYRPLMRVRSPRWGTVGLAGPVFRKLVRPFHQFVSCEPAQALQCPVRAGLSWGSRSHG